ncbi:hypothetical protein BDN70DRAFT_800044 [Pholiota conissans]|uniref:Uncharacterized protein n=1 Tax=Pholiota conissans TaxID=109636 RepID=A0A9P5Z9A9_9AGAR|nr:hypothetical protein BDN70DRAFT_800044 [Pholiota conissans]
MKGYSLARIWKKEHDRGFLRVKVALTREPVLKCPKYDGTPFIITTDGCKFGFAGMCTQKFTTVMPNGIEKTMIVDHASRRKTAFDKRVNENPPREVVFRAGDLVQVYRSDLDYTFRTERKLLPKFSVPRRVVSRNLNSYELETLEGPPNRGQIQLPAPTIVCTETRDRAGEVASRDREGVAQAGGIS